MINAIKENLTNVSPIGLTATESKSVNADEIKEGDKLQVTIGNNSFEGIVEKVGNGSSFIADDLTIAFKINGAISVKNKDTFIVHLL